MAQKLQYTRLHKSIGLAVARLEDWAINPWRRLSILLIVLLASFLIGSTIGTINGALALMDPVAALITVILLELMVRLRRSWSDSNRAALTRQMLDVSRIGLLYGLLVEGFKLF